MFLKFGGCPYPPALAPQLTFPYRNPQSYASWRTIKLRSRRTIGGEPAAAVYHKNKRQRENHCRTSPVGSGIGSPSPTVRYLHWANRLSVLYRRSRAAAQRSAAAPGIRPPGSQRLRWLPVASAGLFVSYLPVFIATAGSMTLLRGLLPAKTGKLLVRLGR